MAKTIWKYQLGLDCILEIPKSGEVLSVHEHGGAVCIWVLVDTKIEKESRRFMVFGTGHPVPEVNLQFHGTAHLMNGALVLHVFELVDCKREESDTKQNQIKR